MPEDDARSPCAAETLEFVMVAPPRRERAIDSETVVGGGRMHGFCLEPSHRINQLDDLRASSGAHPERSRRISAELPVPAVSSFDFAQDECFPRITR